MSLPALTTYEAVLVSRTLVDLGAELDADYRTPGRTRALLLRWADECHPAAAALATWWRAAAEQVPAGSP